MGNGANVGTISVWANRLSVADCVALETPASEASQMQAACPTHLSGELSDAEPGLVNAGRSVSTVATASSRSSYVDEDSRQNFLECYDLAQLELAEDLAYACASCAWAVSTVR
jgi:hypothetical protein